MTAHIAIPGETSAEKISYLFTTPTFMRRTSLGLLLESFRWGSPDSVMWEMSARRMTELIELWTAQNEGDLPELFLSNYQGDTIPEFHPYSERRGFEGIEPNPRSHNFPLGTVIPLEEVLHRLDVTYVSERAWLKPDTHFIALMDGNGIASKTRAWYEQTEGMPPFYN